MKRGRMMRVAAAGLAITAIASACGDDDDSAGDMSDYCEASLALETAPEPDIDFETATPEEIIAATKSFATETFIPLAQRLKETAADEIMDDIDIGMAALNDSAESGDYEVVPRDTRGRRRIGPHSTPTTSRRASGTRWTSPPPTTPSRGCPVSSMPAWRASSSRTEGPKSTRWFCSVATTASRQTVEELLAMPEEEVETKTTMVAETGGAPGASEYAIADLTPGTYAMLCFVPEGTTSEDAYSTGQPHFMRGMVFEFTVA